MAALRRQDNGEDGDPAPRHSGGLLHAAMARRSAKRLSEGLGIRDAIMADNLVYLVGREHGRGKVLCFAHNMHLKCGKAQWQLGPDLLIWWPAGAHLHETFGPRYAVIGAAIPLS